MATVGYTTTKQKVLTYCQTIIIFVRFNSSLVVVVVFAYIFIPLDRRCVYSLCV